MQLSLLIPEIVNDRPNCDYELKRARETLIKARQTVVKGEEEVTVERAKTEELVEKRRRAEQRMQTLKMEWVQTQARKYKMMSKQKSAS